MHFSRPALDVSSWHQKLLAPHSSTPDTQRRELILNILLAVLAVTVVIADLANIINHLTGIAAPGAQSLVMLLVFTAIVLGLWRLSRKGYFEIGAYIFVGFLMLAGLQLVLQWSFELPAAQLVLAIAIIIAGVLLTARAALVVSLVVAGGLIPIGYAQTYGHLHPDLSWSGIKLEMASAIGYAIILFVIGLVAWLANLETAKSLARARASEAELQLERDSLEIKVIERTRELEQAQLVRVMELQRLAEFGRLSAGLLHEVANPLTVASLNLEQLSTEPRPVLLKRAVQSLQHIERFVAAARMQLKGQGSLMNFQLQHEIKQVMSILAHRARESGVKIDLHIDGRPRLYGDPVKFNQLAANLIVNAIEAYDEQSAVEPGKRRISITVEQGKPTITLVVRDWGRGLKSDEISHIFEPFYTNKPSERRNMGIGLAMVEQIVTQDFRGSVRVTSSPKQGTAFKLLLRSQKKPS
ncbi:MAG TPA: ATP-binding protein [Candidatus Saccharimonadales bacterium]